MLLCHLSGLAGKKAGGGVELVKFYDGDKNVKIPYDCDYKSWQV